MNISKERIEEVLEKYEHDYKSVIRELNSAPKGTLIQCKIHGKTTYMKTETVDGKQIKTSINKNTDEIKAYARKAYVSKASGVIESNITVLEKAINKIADYSPEALINQMPRAYQKLPIEYFYADSSFGEEWGDWRRSDALMRHAEWARDKYDKSDLYPENLIHRTSLGFKVRSKSELLIVEKLAEFDIIPRYEQVLYLGSFTFVPDFTFLDYEGEEFYWEHAGLMDDPRYQASHKKKMELYERAGIVPWKNLIVTYDMDGQLNLPMIKSIIEHDVLPRIC